MRRLTLLLVLSMIPAMVFGQDSPVSTFISDVPMHNDLLYLVKNNGGTYSSRKMTVADMDDAIRHATQFTGSDASAKIVAAIADLPAGGGLVDARGLQGAQTISQNMFNGVTKPVAVLLGAGTYTFSVQQVMDCVGCSMQGVGSGTTQGQTSPSLPATVLIKSGNFDGIWLKGNNTSLYNLTVAGAGGNTGDGVFITGIHAVLQDVAVRDQGQDGIRIGQKVTSGVGDGNTNANIARLRGILLDANARDGLHLEDAFDRVDASQGLIDGIYTQFNGRHGIYAKGNLGVQNEMIEWQMYGVMSSSNTGKGIELDQGVSGFFIPMPYTEANVSKPEINLETNTWRNVIWGIRSGAVGYPTGGLAGPVSKSPDITDVNNGSTGNLIMTRIGTDCCVDIPEFWGYYFAGTTGFGKLIIQDSAAGVSHYWTLHHNTANNYLRFEPTTTAGAEAAVTIVSPNATSSVNILSSNNGNSYIVKNEDNLLVFQQNGADAWIIDTSAVNHRLIPAADNTEDLCSSGSRCRSIYAGTSIVDSGTFSAAAGAFAVDSSGNASANQITLGGNAAQGANTVNAGLYYRNGTPGGSATISVRKGDGSAACTITFASGLFISSTC